jgi:hypothetical protein
LHLHAQDALEGARAAQADEGGLVQQVGAGLLQCS